jgi:hypothetical protein
MTVASEDADAASPNFLMTRSQDCRTAPQGSGVLGLRSVAQAERRRLACREIRREIIQIDRIGRRNLGGESQHCDRQSCFHELDLGRLQGNAPGYERR